MAATLPPSPANASAGPAGAVAQLGGRRNRTAEVRGSNPLGSTKDSQSFLWFSDAALNDENTETSVWHNAGTASNGYGYNSQAGTLLARSGSTPVTTSTHPKLLT